MNKDIRVVIGFFDHRKTRKLIKKYGLDAAWGLLRLWAFAAESRSDGYLTNMSDEDIAMECHMDGKVDPTEFVAYLKSEECRWIDQTERGLYLHDWHVHQKLQKWWYAPESIKNVLQRKLRAYKHWRRSVVVRDNFTCKRCGFINKSNHAHHIDPWANYHDKRYDVSNGITLCCECHKNIHAGKGDAA